MNRALGLFVLLPAAALCQTTDCYTVAVGRVQCNTIQAPGTPSAGGTDRAMRELLNMTGRGYESMQQVEADKQLDRERLLRLKVGQLVAAGDCVAAKRVALDNGDLDLAQKVVAVC